VDILDRLDAATEALLEQNRRLKAENIALQAEKHAWHNDRSHLLSEIERILKRLDDVQLEES
jgi:uncharacterized protein (TIGR02449 family)